MAFGGQVARLRFASNKNRAKLLRDLAVRLRKASASLAEVAASHWASNGAEGVGWAYAANSVGGCLAHSIQTERATSHFQTHGAHES